MIHVCHDNLVSEEKLEKKKTKAMESKTRRPPIFLNPLGPSPNRFLLGSSTNLPLSLSHSLFPIL